MESAHDSIKYIMPVYTSSMGDQFADDIDDIFDPENGSFSEVGPFGGKASHYGTQSRYDHMDNRFDDVAHHRDVMYESSESRYATELCNVEFDADALTVQFVGGAFDSAANEGSQYIPGDSALYVMVDGRRMALAIQDGRGSWFCGNPVLVKKNAVAIKVSKVERVDGEVNKFEFTMEKADVVDGVIGDFAEGTEEGLKYLATGRYDMEADLTGEYLGEVELVMKDYHFMPRPISLGVTWTQLTELVLDTSFGVSAEEMLMDSAAQEIKKTLDFQAIKYASDMQRVAAKENSVAWDCAADEGHYYQCAQLVTQAIDRIGDLQLNAINRGGVSAIVGGPAAVNYLMLNKGWSDKGKQAAIGGHKVGELNGEKGNAVVKVA